MGRAWCSSLIATDLYWKSADGSGTAERLTEGDETHSPVSWSPVGRILAFQRTPEKYNSDLWLQPMDGAREPKPFLATPFAEQGAEFSPDGRWIAYTSNESGRREVYVRPYPGPGPRHQISTAGGGEPAWNPHGKKMFYRSYDGKMMVVGIELTPEVEPGTPKVLFEDRFDRGNVAVRDYDVTPDGQRFLMIEAGEQHVASEIIVVTNWFEELKRLVPTN